jgi:hypothetical protein
MSTNSAKLPCIVFAHLGPVKTSHVWLNMERTHSIFPSLEIHFITDLVTEIPERIREFVQIHKYQRTPEVDYLRKSHSHDANFRQGFWWLSLERILAVGQAHFAIGDRPIIHLESDVILMPNFPFDFFTDSQIYWCRYNETKDVAAVLRLASLDQTKWLMNEIICRVAADSAHTDMTVLSEISRSDSIKVGVLPSFGTSKIDLRNSNCDLEAIDKFAHLNHEGINGVFDAAPIGMWLSGQDPKNYYGITRYRMRNIIDSGDSFVDPSNLALSYDSRDGLRISNGIYSLEIWNLHIHSKNLKLFGTDWEKELLRIIEIKEPKKEFNYKIFLALLILNFKQGTFWRFCLGIPPIYRLIRPLRDRLYKR